MTKLYIDNQLADMDPATSLSLSFSPEELGSSAAGALCSKSITIAATPRNRQLLGDCGHPYSKMLFNHFDHRARLEVCGCVVFEGRLHLIASATGKRGYYRFRIVSDRAEWRKVLGGAIGSLDVDWSSGFTASEIRDSWTAEGAMVRFLPVARGTGRGVEHYRGRVLPENYHPFIHLDSLLRAMFAKAGYAIESEFMDSEFFRSLYMSGRWSEKSADSWRLEMDFKALRGADSSTVEANELGQVYASPLRHYNTVGNVVEVPDYYDFDAYNAGCFGLEESSGRICFTPTREVTVAFDYLLRWRSEYRIASRTELSALNRVTFGADDSEKVTLRHNNHDFRGEGLDANHSYNLIIFDPVEGATYRLLADEGVAGGQTREVVVTNQRSTLLSHSYAQGLVNLRLEMELGGHSYMPLSDWAIYDGYVSEYGVTDLQVQMRTHPQRCSPSEPAYFDTLCFEGGEQGMQMTLLAGCCLQPVFYPHPIVDERLSWRDVANLPTTGMELLGSLQELFDLTVQTDTTLRTVRIEPRRDFCNAGVVDLSELIDPSEPILLEELGDDSSRHFRLAYRKGDAAVEEYCQSSGESYGEWQATIYNLFADEGTRSVENNLFVASLSEQGGVGSAPSAQLIATRTGADPAPRCLHNLNFPTKIISLRGLSSLPNGESWNYPTKGEGVYPLLTFFDDGSLGGSPCSLLFEDRDGVEGLHKWWDSKVAELNTSRRVVLHLHLRPEDIEHFALADSSGRNFRSLYQVEVDGEKVLCRLESVSGYDPTAASVKVVFVTQ